MKVTHKHNPTHAHTQWPLIRPCTVVCRENEAKAVQMHGKAECSKSHLLFGELLSQGHYGRESVHVCECVPLHTVCAYCVRVCVSLCLVNTIMQPFSAIPECSKTIKHQTEVLTVDYSGSTSEPGIMKLLCSIKLLYVNTY